MPHSASGQPHEHQEERPAIRPQDDPAGHVSCLVGLLTGQPTGGDDRHRTNAYFRQPY